MYFKRKELEKFRSFKGPLIDVRSPSEYYKGHMPNSINIPLFDNDERSIIGTIYKKEGRKKAVIEGLKFFEKKIEFFLDNLFMNIDSYKKISEKNNKELFIRIYCSRGGMRSQSIAWLLEKFKLNLVTLKGGYKIYRRWVLDSFSKKLNIVVIGGKTGTGKTRLLSLLEKYNSLKRCRHLIESWGSQRLKTLENCISILIDNPSSSSSDNNKEIDDLFKDLNSDAIKFQELYYLERQHISFLDKQRCGNFIAS